MIVSNEIQPQFRDRWEQAHQEAHRLGIPVATAMLHVGYEMLDEIERLERALKDAYKKLGLYATVNPHG